jgi:hypothetical protein
MQGINQNLDDSSVYTTLYQSVYQIFLDQVDFMENNSLASISFVNNLSF